MVVVFVLGLCVSAFDGTEGGSCQHFSITVKTLSKGLKHEMNCLRMTFPVNTRLGRRLQRLTLRVNLMEILL